MRSFVVVLMSFVVAAITESNRKRAVVIWEGGIINFLKITFCNAKFLLRKDRSVFLGLWFVITDFRELEKKLEKV